MTSPSTPTLSKDSQDRLAKIDRQLVLERKYVQGAQKTLEARRRLLESGGATTTSRQQREIQAELERALTTAQHKVQHLLQERSKLVQVSALMKGHSTEYLGHVSGIA